MQRKNRKTFHLQKIMMLSVISMPQLQFCPLFLSWAPGNPAQKCTFIHPCNFDLIPKMKEQLHGIQFTTGPFKLSKEQVLLMPFSVLKMHFDMQEMFVNLRKYRVIQILCTHTDGCRLWPWLAYLPGSRPSYWRCFQTLTQLFQFIFRVDGHAHRHTFAKQRR